MGMETHGLTLWRRGQYAHVSMDAIREWLWDSPRLTGKHQLYPGGHWQPLRVLQAGQPVWKIRKERNRFISTGVHGLAERVTNHCLSVDRALAIRLLDGEEPGRSTLTEAFQGQRDGGVLLRCEDEFIPAWLAGKLSLMMTDAEQHILRLRTWTPVRDIHAPSFIRWNHGCRPGWELGPFLGRVSFALSCWLGHLEPPAQQSTAEGESGNMIPRFIEHFPQDETEVIPNDGSLRLAWHPVNSELGSLKTEDRYLELGENTVVEHVSTSAKAVLHTVVNWFDEDSLNITVQVNSTSELENGILRIILIEDDVKMFGRAPPQHAVVRLYDPTPIGDGNGTISRNLQMPNGLNEGDAENLQVIILLSDMLTEENYAMMALELPSEEMVQSTMGNRVATWLAISVGIFVLASIARAEWKREVFLPRLRGNPGQNGTPVAQLKAGLGDVKLREVRVLPPWKLAKQIRDIELRAGTEKTLQVHFETQSRTGRRTDSICSNRMEY